MKPGFGRAVVWIWALFSAAVLLTTLYFFDGKPNSDVETLLVYGMLILAFPLSFAVSATITLILLCLNRATGYVLQTTHLSLTLVWTFYFMVGLIQWKYLLPKLSHYGWLSQFISYARRIRDGR